MVRMMKILDALSFVIVFFGSALGLMFLITGGLVLIWYPLWLTIPALFFAMFLGSDYAYRILYSLDQFWGVLLSPVFNLWPHKHKFGAPDETPSSVIGKNLRDTNHPRYVYTEFIMSKALEFGKPHAIKSIEDDEGMGKR